LAVPHFVTVGNACHFGILFHIFNKISRDTLYGACLDDRGERISGVSG